MVREILPAALLLAAAAVPLPTQAKTAIMLKSTQVQLPQSDAMFPAGPGSQTADNNCLACHSVDMVMNQPALSKSAWEAEVAKMRNGYKAPVAEADVAPIVDYLVHIKGVK
jgi:cytochrome c5